MTEIKMLEYSEEKKFLDYFDSIDIENETRFLVSHEIDLNALDELTLKRLLFDYQIIIYYCVDNGDIKNFIMFKVPPVTQKSNTLNILALGIYDISFVKNVFVEVKKRFEKKGWGKISFEILKFQINDYYKEVFDKIGLHKEVELKAGQESYNQIIYGYLF